MTFHDMKELFFLSFFDARALNLIQNDPERLKKISKLVLGPVPNIGEGG